MKKICFITMGNLYTVPYLKSYTKYIDGSYSVIYWDREGKREEEEQRKEVCPGYFAWLQALYIPI